MAFSGFSLVDNAAPCFPLRSKRKDVDDVADHLSEFSLAGPAMKIRRLDVGMPVIVDQAQITTPMIFEHMNISQEKSDAASSSDIPVPNNEMAIVLYKPMNTWIPSGVSLMVDSNFIASIKNKNLSCLVQRPARDTNNGEGEEGSDDYDKMASAANTCMAVVPWLPSQVPDANRTTKAISLHIGDEMDSGMETETMMMDVEGEVGQTMAGAAPAPIPAASVGMGPFDSLQQWQQQHCMYPDATTNIAAPMTWSW